MIPICMHIIIYIYIYAYTRTHTHTHVIQTYGVAGESHAGFRASAVVRVSSSGELGRFGIHMHKIGVA